MSRTQMTRAEVTRAGAIRARDGWRARDIPTTVLLLAALVTTALTLPVTVVAAAPGETASFNDRVQAPSTFATIAFQRGDLLRGHPLGTPYGLAQRAIEDEKPKTDPDDEEDEPLEPVPPEEIGAEDIQEQAKSPVTAMLLSALVPGVGELYVGSNTGFIFLGIDAVSWLTWGSYRSSSSSKEDEMFVYADDHFSPDLFDDQCVSRAGQTCVDASQQLRWFWDNDKPEYYEIISKNTIYKSGWGVVQYENNLPPEAGTEAYRIWVANFANAQDVNFIRYNELRDERNDLSRTARGMTVVMLLNRLVSAWHAFALAGGLNKTVAGDIEMELNVKPSFSNPGATFVLSRSFY